MRISRLEFALADGTLPKARPGLCDMRLACNDPIIAAVEDVASDCDPTKSSQASSPPTNNAGGLPSLRGL